MWIRFSGRLGFYLAAFFFAAYLFFDYLDFRDDPGRPWSSGDNALLIPVVFGLILLLRSLLVLVVQRRDTSHHSSITSSTLVHSTEPKPLRVINWPALVLAIIVCGLIWFASQPICGVTWESLLDLHDIGSWLLVIVASLMVALLARMAHLRLFKQSITQTEPVATHTANLGSRPLYRISGLPPFGLCASIVFFSVVTPLMIFEGWHTGYKGIYVWLVGARIHGTNVSPAMQPLIVRIDFQRRLYLNSQPCAVSELREQLLNQLSKRPDWVVYVDGDNDIPFSDVASIVDLIHDVHAKPVLLTSNRLHSK